MTTINSASQPKIENATLTIAIGRNIHPALVSGMIPSNIEPNENGSQLVDYVWKFFLGSIFCLRGETPNVSTTGRGEWYGVSEETAVFSWYDSNPLTPKEYSILREYAVRHGQESIAVSYSVPQFI